MADDLDRRRWQPRPLLGAAVHGLLVAIPIVLAVAVGTAVARLLPPPTDPGQWVLQLGAAVTASTAVLLAGQRLVRRLLPLSFLLKLTMAFPGAAPSRWRVARDAGRLRDLEAAVARARSQGLDDDPTRAAREVLSLVSALAGHDRRTRGHSERVRVFTDLVASELRLSTADRDRLRWAALLHDIGKLEVPERVLNKPGRPTDVEWRLLRQHPQSGAEILAPLAEFLGPWVHAARDHHERWDGGGYPDGRSGRQISYAGRVVAVTDAYEVMTAARAYKRPMSAKAARAELAACAGTQFDVAIVRAFLAVPLWRLRWSLGPMAWVAQLPLLRDVAYVGGSLGSAVASAAPGIAATAGVLTALGAGPALGADGELQPPDLSTAPIADRDAPTASEDDAPVQPPARASDDEPAGRPVDPGPAQEQDDEPGAGDDDSTDSGGDSQADDDASPSPSDDDRDTHGSTDGQDETTEPENDVVEDTTDTIDDTTKPVTDVVDDTTETADDTTQPVTDVVDDTTETVDDTTKPVTDVVDDTTEPVQDTTEPVTDVVDDTTEMVDDTTSTADDVVVDSTGTVDDTTDDLTGTLGG